MDLGWDFGSGYSYICDTFAHVIRRYEPYRDPTSNIFTFAGSASGGGFYGDGGNATAGYAVSAVGHRSDWLGNEYIRDSGNLDSWCST